MHFRKFNFAPTGLSKQNLLKEGRDPAGIYVTGNTAIDALKTTVRETYTHPELEWAKDSRLIMITAHRRENLGEPMRHMFKAIRRVMDEHPDVKAIYPIHMNPVVRETANEYLGDDDRIHIIEPLDVLDFHNFLSRSYLILTDSGGIQEEAPSLGKPVLVMRDTTERPEGIAAGTLKLVGTEEETIYKEFSRLLSDKNEHEAMSKASNPYGDGYACERIADILEAIAVAGTGYVGLSIATLLSQHHEVMAVDIIPEKVDLINHKKSPIQDEYIEKYLADKDLNLTATLDAEAAYKEADFVVIAAPTNV